MRQIVQDDPIPNWVTLDRAISLAQSELGMDGDEYRHLMREWAKVAMDQIGLFHISRQTKTIEVSAGGRFNKPCGFIAPLSIQLRGLDGSTEFPSGCITPTFDPWIGGCTTCENTTARGTCATVRVTEAKDFFQVQPKPTSGYMDLIYWAYMTDSEGRMLIPRYAYDAISAHIQWKAMKVRQRREGYRMIPRGDVEAARRDWLLACRAAKGRKNTPNPAQMPTVAGSWLMMSPNIRGLLQHRIEPFLQNV